MDPCAPLPVSPLSAYGFFVTAVRPAVPAFQRYGDRTVFDGPPAGWPHLGRSRGVGRTTEYALPARPVLDTPVPEAGGAALCGAGGVDRTGCGLELRRACLAHAAIDRLDGGPPLPVCRSAIPPVGLASVSRSPRAGNRAPAGGAARLRPHTQLLPGVGAALGLMLLASGGHPHGGQGRENRPLSVWRDRVV